MRGLGAWVGGPLPGHQPTNEPPARPPGRQHAAAGHRSGSQETYSPRNALIAGISRTA